MVQEVMCTFEDIYVVDESQKCDELVVTHKVRSNLLVRTVDE